MFAAVHTGLLVQSLFFLKALTGTEHSLSRSLFSKLRLDPKTYSSVKVVTTMERAFNLRVLEQGDSVPSEESVISSPSHRAPLASGRPHPCRPGATVYHWHIVSSIP